MTEALDRAVGATAFGTDVAGYAAGRLDYPDRLYETLAHHCSLRDGISVLEIGPGTGQATRKLLDAGVARVTAVEPDPALAAHLRDWGDARLDVDQRAFGPAIAGDRSFDLIVAATSFHWLESASALCDVRRLLKPGGAFAMWWNVFQEPGEDRLFDALFEGLARPPSLLGGQHYSLDSGARCAELATAGLVDIEHFMLSRIVKMTPASLRQLFSTFSAVRNLSPVCREERLAAAERLALLECGEEFYRTFRTPLYIARRRMDG